MKAQDIIKAALRVVGAIATGETPAAAELADGLTAFQSMLRGWSAERMMVFAVNIENFTLTAGQSSYTIGSGGDFDTTRPVKIDHAYIRGSDNLDTSLKIIDQKKYSEIALKGESDTPAWLWYNPTYGSSGLGKIYLFPVGGGTIYLHSVRPLTEPTALTSDMELPPEYDEACKWNLAVRLAPEYGKAVDPDVRALAISTKNHLIEYNASMAVEAAKLEILDLSKRWHINEG